MTDNEIIEVLEICSNIVTSGCRECRLYSMHNANCVVQAMRNALDIIKRYKSELEKKDIEIDILIRKNEALKDEVAALRAEVGRLLHIIACNRATIDYVKERMKIWSSEARKEFAERLKKRAASRTYCTIFESDVDDLLAEMESERK